MFDTILHLLQSRGLFAVMPLLFLAFGLGHGLYALWNFVTGGPRAIGEVGTPYLYDRFYFLLQVSMAAGWLIAVSSFAVAVIAGAWSDDASGFMLGWAVMAVSIGLLFTLRGGMLVRGMQYRASHSRGLLGWFYRMQLARMENQPEIFRTLIGGLFAVIGAVILVINLPHVPAILGQVGRDLAAAGRALGF
ncbi:MAG: hypothetical protein JF615_02845 [Asticcacaulis sp.]|nr:hypothetical protein [Asticcacaulis sp.]